MKSLPFFLLFCFTGIETQAGCLILGASSQKDAVSAVLQSAAFCPANVQEFKAELEHQNLKTEIAMVANRGRHNPEQGSFSFFEQAYGTHSSGLKVEIGDFFFGHFTENIDGVIGLDQTPTPRKLMIELIAWDSTAGLFNFYELIGSGSSSKWFFRGNSLDALNDNKFLYREVPAGKSKFGSAMRCSGCHSSGGPIMKELQPPFNDWWTDARPLSLGNNRPSEEVARFLNQTADAAGFSAAVKTGINKLEKSKTYQQMRTALSLQEQLRPLFCENEINLASDLIPLEKNHPEIKIPSAFSVNPLLLESPQTISTEIYTALLKKNNMRFPETTQTDADHAWLTPVKGFSDQLAIETLIQKQVISRDFAIDVLAVDWAHPLFSAERCALLKFLPEFPTDGWQQKFIQKVHLPKMNPQQIKPRAKFEDLLSLRKAVFKSEISQNPRGQILEPGFRVIFAEPVPELLP